MTSKKIIIIDDDPDIITYIGTLLNDNGYETVTAVDGNEGIIKIRSEKPDLILLDITMPEKSGVGLYKVVRHDPDLRKIPVIMVTGVTKDFKRFIHTRKQIAPPDGYLSKPVNPKELLDLILKLLK